MISKHETPSCHLTLIQNIKPKIIQSDDDCIQKPKKKKKKKERRKLGDRKKGDLPSENEVGICQEMGKACSSSLQRPPWLTPARALEFLSTVSQVLITSGANGHLHDTLQNFIFSIKEKPKQN